MQQFDSDTLITSIVSVDYQLILSADSIGKSIYIYIYICVCVCVRACVCVIKILKSVCSWLRKFRSSQKWVISSTPSDKIFYLQPFVITDELFLKTRCHHFII